MIWQGPNRVGTTTVGSWIAGCNVMTAVPIAHAKAEARWQELVQVRQSGSLAQSVVSSIDRHLSALEFLALPTRIRKPPGMPTNRVSQLQQDGIKLARRLHRLTQGFGLAFHVRHEDLGKVAK